MADPKDYTDEFKQFICDTFESMIQQAIAEHPDDVPSEADIERYFDSAVRGEMPPWPGAGYTARVRSITFSEDERDMPPILKRANMMVETPTDFFPDEQALQKQWRVHDPVVAMHFVGPGTPSDRWLGALAVRLIDSSAEPLNVYAHDSTMAEYLETALS